MSNVSRLIFFFVILVLIIFFIIQVVQKFQKQALQQDHVAVLITPTVGITPSPTPTSTNQPLSPEEYAAMKGTLVSRVQSENPTMALDFLQNQVIKRPVWAQVCHALAHEVGHAAYDKYNDYTIAVSYRDDTCGSGYLHGLIEYRLKGVDPAKILEVIKSICPSEDAQDCYHGVGHGAMFYTSNTIPSALKLCDETYSKDAYKVACGEGVFMENFNTDEVAHASQYLNAIDPFSTCREQSVLYKGPCYFYVPDYYLTLHKDQFLSALQWCDGAEKPFETACYDGVGSRLMKYHIDTLNMVQDICEKSTDVQKTYCIDGAVSYHLVHYKSLKKTTTDFCGLFNDIDKKLCLSSVGKRSSQFPE